MDTSSIPGLELIQVADVVAREKSIEREEVMVAMEEAIQKAGRAKYGLDRDIRAMIDRKTCLLYTSPSPRDQRGSRMPSSA